MKKTRDFEIVLKYLLNENLLKNALKGCDLETLDRAKTTLSTVCSELKDELELQRIEAEEREQKRLDIIAAIEAQGFTLNELIKSKPKKAPSKKPNKYAYPDDNGKIIYWSGMGKMPKLLRKQVENGKALESFLIDGHSNQNQE